MKGRSTGPNSLALWTHKFQPPISAQYHFVPAGCDKKDTPDETVLIFGAGAQWRTLYAKANDLGFAIVGGTCGTVGSVGWLHGGGHSPLSPTFGLGVDNVREVTVILPSGKEVVASRCQNSHIFKAIKGGGGGTFGVVTRMAYKLIPKTHIQVCHGPRVFCLGER